MNITYPVLTVVDDDGIIVADATVTVASVTDKANSAISSPGVTVNQAGANVSVDYDVEAKGEAWITLSVAKSGANFSGLNGSPSIFIAKDSQRIMTSLPNAAPAASDGLPTTAATASSVLAGTFEGSWTVSDFLKLAVAALAGNSTAGGTHYTSPVDGSTARITASVDSSYNRTVSSLNRS